MRTTRADRVQTAHATPFEATVTRLRARTKHLATAASHVLAVLAWLVTDDDTPKPPDA